MLEATEFIDSDHPDVVRFAQNIAGQGDERQRVERLYYAVRDGFRYDPYKIDLSRQGMRASTVLADGYGWCVPKAVLLAAVCRAIGVPARLGLADVRNHLSTERLRAAMETDMFYGHGYTAIQINGGWFKATPAFNVELCTKMNLAPLDFDGTKDSLYHSYDLAGNRYMEYVSFRGEFDDLPHDMIVDIFRQHYSRLAGLDKADWDADVQAEKKDPS